MKILVGNGREGGEREEEKKILTEIVLRTGHYPKSFTYTLSKYSW